MPQQIYTVEIDGTQYDIEGDRPPTEAEARQAVGAFKSEPTAPATPAATPSLAAGTRPVGRVSMSQAATGGELNAPASSHRASLKTIGAIAGTAMAGPVLRSAGLAAGPVAARVADSPLGQAAIGGVVGGIQGGSKGALSGAIMGAAGGGIMNRILKHWRNAGGAAASGVHALAPKPIEGSLLFAPGEMVPAINQMATMAKAQGLPPNQVQALVQQMHRDFLLRSLDKVPIQDAGAKAASATLAAGFGTRR